MRRLFGEYPRETDDSQYFTQGDGRYWYRPDAGSVFWLWSIPLILSTFSVVAISTLMGWTHNGFGMKQAVWLCISLCAFIIVTQIPLKFWYRSSFPLLVLSFILLLCTVYSPLRVTAGGASRWIRLGPVSFQPLEFASLAIMLELSKVYLRENRITRAALLSLLILLPFGIVIMKQPDFGGLLLLVSVCGALFVECYGIFLPLLTAFCVLPLFLRLGGRGYRAGRVLSWLNPWSDPSGAGYQVIQGLIAFANGGIWGSASASARFLPELHNDFIFAAIGQQWGLVGTMSIFLVFLFWTANICLAYRRARRGRRIYIWGCCVSVVLTYLINLGGIMKIIPLTGMPLPFVSYGGTSLLFMWIRIGLLIRLVREPYA